MLPTNLTPLEVIDAGVMARANDCSMSNHIVLNSNRKYVNIEVQHGQTRVQRALLAPALRALR